jgi:hypothetical protein
VGFHNKKGFNIQDWVLTCDEHFICSQILESGGTSNSNSKNWIKGLFVCLFDLRFLHIG